MDIHDPSAFWGNLIALFAVGGKTAYDLWINPYQFKKDPKYLDSPLEAVKRKRERGDRSTMITFGLLAISYFLMLLAAI